MAATSHKHEVLLTSDNSGQLWNCCVWDPNTGSTLTSYKVGGDFTVFKGINLYKIFNVKKKVICALCSEQEV